MTGAGFVEVNGSLKAGHAARPRCFLGRFSPLPQAADT
jgi:hypothetical protein